MAFDHLFEAAGRKYNVDPALLRAIGEQESGLDPKATGPQTKWGTAKGMMQIIDPTAKGLGVTDPYDPEQAINGAAKLLSEALDRNGNVADAVTEYHGGPDRKLWGPKTRKYREEVMARYGGESGGQVSASEEILFGSGGGDKAAPSKAEQILFGGSATEIAAPKPATTGIGPQGEITFGDTGAAVTPEQAKTYKALAAARAIDPNAPAGSMKSPYMQRTEHDTFGPGEFYISATTGKLARMPGGEDEDKSSITKGLAQGVADVGLSVAQILPGLENSEIGNRLFGGQQVYDVEYKGDPMSGAGRLTGQILGAGIPMAAGGAIVAPALGATGAGAFLAGRGGLQMAPGAARLLTRGASLATSGAGQGALGAGLTSSASDAPLGDQLMTGAAAGGIAGPLIPGVVGGAQAFGRGVRNFVEPLTGPGQERIVSRLIGQFPETATTDMRELVPGSVPTLGEAAGSPALAAIERNARTNPKLSSKFTDRDAINDDARIVFLDDIRGDRSSVDDLVSARNEQVSRARATAFQNASPIDGRTIASVLDSALTSPEAQMESVSRPLQQLRDKLVRPAAESTPQQVADFNRAVSQTFGADAPALTPEVMHAARSRLGGEFERIAAETNVPWDDNLRQGIGQIIADTAMVVPESQIPPLFRQLDNIASTANQGGEISGASYQALTKKGAPLSSLQNSSDPTIREAANRIRETLDDALERSLGAQGAGAATALDELRNVRLQYKNLKTVEGALKQSGVDRTVTPQSVLAAVKRNFGQYAYQGGGTLGDVAEAAVREIDARPVQVQNDARQVYGMRQSLETQIGKLEKSGTDADIAAAARIQSVLDAMDSTISQSVPGYSNFLSISRSTAEPIEVRQYLQGLNLKNTNGKVTLGLVQRALDQIEKARGMPGRNPAKLVSQDTIDQLTLLRDDLKRAGNINLGKAKGSDSVQNLVTGKFTEESGIPLALGLVGAVNNPIAAGAIGLGKLAYRAKQDEVLDKLGNRLLDPSPVARPVAANAPKNRIRLGGSMIPVSAGVLSGRLVGGQ